MHFPESSLFFALAATAAASSDPTTPTSQVPACTATSSTGSGAFFDLRPDAAVPPVKGSHNQGPTKDYFSKGYDYGKNFTLNICGPVVDQVSDVVGISEDNWANISAYYISGGETYSIGSQSLDLKSRGRKLILQYTGGSPCGESATKPRRGVGSDYFDTDRTAGLRGDKKASSQKVVTTRRKSTIISFLCDRDPSAAGASVSFVGTDPDECAYFFEARSIHACAHAEPHKPGSVGPGSVFGLILVIAVLVYILGGIFYNRTVTHARGWRQIPNYSLWAGIWSFISDMFVIALSSCAQRFPSRQGYSHLSANSNRDAEAENRLIDQLDEEWDD